MHIDSDKLEMFLVREEDVESQFHTNQQNIC